MALVLNDRVKETTTGTGTGTVNLAGAETGFETFVAGIGNTNTTYYAIVHQAADEFEVGLGTVSDSSPDTLSRTTIISSSNSDSAVNFSAGTKDVFCTLPASKAVFLNSSADINLADNSKILLGAGDDLQLYHDGSNSYIADAGTGSLFLRGTDEVKIQSAIGNNFIQSTINAGTKIYFSDAEKFETVSGGVKVTGNIENASGSMTIDVADNLSLDVDGGNIALKDAGTQWGNFANNGGDFEIDSNVQDKDIKFNGNDGGSTITALTLDMSDAGRGVFTGGIDIAANTDIEGNYGNWTGEKSAKLQFHSGHFYIQTTNSLYFRNYSGGNGDDKISFDNGGNIVAEGNITAYGSVSDERLKENIEVIDNAVDKVKQLKGITFNYKKDGKEGTGLIAQDLEKVLPEAVYTAKTLGDHLKDEKEEEHLAINYGNTVGLLVEAIKEQQEQIETLTAKVKELEVKG